VYRWLWRRLPGGPGARLVQLLVVVAAVGALLWFLVYPWASMHLPVDPTGLG
jgi:hypothetical protein